MMFGLDHVGLAVKDLAAAYAAWDRLGFALTERSLHMNRDADDTMRPAGTGNHCVILHRGYIELIAAVDPAYAGRLNADVARYEGLHLLALGAASAQAASEQIARATDTAIASRRVTRPFTDRGDALEAAFDIIDVPSAVLPWLHIFAIHHVTPDVIWRPKAMTHPNGAQGLLGAVLCADDPRPVAAQIAGAFGVEARDGAVPLDAGLIEVLDRQQVEARFPGTAIVPGVSGVALTVRVADLVEIEHLLAVRGVTVRRNHDRLWVAAHEACGACLEFLA